MATNLTEIAFTESGNTVNVVLRDGDVSNVEATSFEMQEQGVMTKVVASGTATRRFIPYGNVAYISQTETV